MSILKFHPLQRDNSRVVVAQGTRDRRAYGPELGRTGAWSMIATKLGQIGQTWPVELTSTRRDVMGFRMSIEREAVGGRADVYLGRSYLATRRSTDHAWKTEGPGRSSRR